MVCRTVSAPRLKRVLTPSAQQLTDRTRSLKVSCSGEWLTPWQGWPQLEAVQCFLFHINQAPVVGAKPDFYHLRLMAGFSVPPHSCSRVLPDCAPPPLCSQGAMGGMGSCKD